MSLLELMITLGILSIILAIILVFMSWNHKQAQESVEREHILNIFKSVANLNLCPSLQTGIATLQTPGGPLPPNFYDVLTPGKISPPVQFSGTAGIGDAFTNNPSLDERFFRIFNGAGNEVLFDKFFARLRPVQQGGLFYLELQYKGNPPRVTGSIDLTNWGDPLGVGRNKRFLANAFVSGDCN